MTRKILHLDLDAFFCSVEELYDPSLKGKPFAVGGRADQRGVVASCSYAARVFGVRSAMPMAHAIKLCPELTIVSHRHGNYGEMSKKVMTLIEISPLIEKISIDEAFIDVSDIPDPLIQIAQILQQRINTELHLPISIGGATNKLVAKIANDWGKSQKKSDEPPNTITIIPPGEEAAFLSPLPAQSLWGIGPKTAKKLAEVGITTIGGLAHAPETTLEILFGRFGPDLKQRAMGIDNRQVENEHDIKSVSNEVTFPEDITDEKELLRTLRDLSDQVGRRLRHASLAGTTIQIKLRWSDFTTISRQATLPSNTNLDDEIYRIVMNLFKDNWDKKKPIRLVGVGVSGLGPPIHQLTLWKDDHQKEAKLMQAVDQLKQRYGKNIIKRAHNLPENNQDEPS
jgi:DNA polymerase-4